MAVQKQEKPSENLYQKYTLTFKDYVNKCLYDQNYGYYIKQAKIGNVELNGDFETLAGPWAPLLVERFFKVWQGMVIAGEISENEPFHVIEFAAGTGDLASTFLNYMKGNVFNENQSKWSQFKKILKYNIIEISPRLIAQQKQRLAPFLEEGIVNITQGDAREAINLFTNKVGVVVSNELIDNFPPHEIHIKNIKNKLSYSFALVLPTITETKKDFQLKQTNSENLAKRFGLTLEDISELRQENRRICTLVEMEKYLLDSESRNKIKMIKFYVNLSPLDSCGMLNNFEHSYINSVLLAATPLFKKKIRAGSTKLIYLKPDVQKYYENIKRVLTKGYVFTLDYGKNANFYLEFPDERLLRTYADQHVTDELFRTAKSPLIKIGEQDITCDVNFSDLDLCGNSLGFQTEYFGTQDSLGGAFTFDFSVHIQSYQLSLNSRNKINEYLLSGMLKTIPIDYKDMPSLCAQYEEGKSLFRLLKNISKAVILSDSFQNKSDVESNQLLKGLNNFASSTKLSEAFRNYLDWLKKIDYLHTNYAQVGRLEIRFFRFLKDRMNQSNNFSAPLLQDLDLDDVKIIISVMTHIQWDWISLTATPKEELLANERLTDNFRKRQQLKHPNLDDPNDCEKTYYQFNMIKHPKLDSECTQLELSLRVARILLNHKEVDELKTAEEWKNFGNVFFNEKQFSKALLCFDIALKLSPQYKEAALNRGFCHKNLRSNDKALTAFKLALEIDPSYAKAIFNIMKIFSEQGKYQSALDSYKAVKNNLQKDAAGLKLCEDLATKISKNSNTCLGNSSFGFLNSTPNSKWGDAESFKDCQLGILSKK